MSTLDTQDRTAQRIPRHGMTSTHDYHLHSLLNNNPITAKEAEKKTNPKAIHKSTATAQPTPNRKYPATATAQPSSGPLGNFIRSVVVYAWFCIWHVHLIPVPPVSVVQVRRPNRIPPLHIPMNLREELTRFDCYLKNWALVIVTNNLWGSS